MSPVFLAVPAGVELPFHNCQDEEETEQVTAQVLQTLTNY